MCATSWKNSLLPHLTKLFQLNRGSINFYYFLLFYSKEFVSLSQKLDNHTTNSSKVCGVTLMVESSLGIPNVPKVTEGKKKEKKKYSKQIQNPWGLWGETSHDSLCLLSLSTADVFQQDQVQFNLSKHFIPTPAPNGRKKGSVQ